MWPRDGLRHKPGVGRGLDGVTGTGGAHRMPGGDRPFTMPLLNRHHANESDRRDCVVIGVILATAWLVRRQRYVAQTHKIGEGVYLFCATA